MRLLLLFMLAVLAPALRGGEIFDFAQLSDRIELVHYQKGSAAKVGKIDGRDALELFFDPARNSWNTVAIKKYQRPRLPLFRKCRIALEVWLPRNHAVRSVNLELCDSTGEMLQYPGVVSAQDHGRLGDRYRAARSAQLGRQDEERCARRQDDDPEFLLQLQAGRRCGESCIRKSFP